MTIPRDDASPAQGIDVEAAPLTRIGLYDAVWREPMRTVAARYRISDVGLAKRCKELEIPVPARGYWQKLRVGQVVRRTPLPMRPSLAARPDEVVLERRPAKAERSPAPAVEAQARFEEAPDRRIVVPSMLLPRRHLHHVVCDFLTRGKRPVSDEDATLDVRVSRATQDRALRILDTLFKALEERGYPVECRHPRPWSTSSGYHGPISWPGRQRGRVTCVAVQEQDVLLMLRETERRTTDRAPLRPEYMLVKSGRLSLSIPHHVGGWQPFRTWSDGKGKRPRQLEDQLNSVIVGIVEAAEEYRATIATWRQRDEERRLRDEEARRSAADEAERKKLLDALSFIVQDIREQVTAWSDARTIRAFVVAVRAGGPEAVERVARQGWPGEDWLSFVERYADVLDPLQPRSSSTESGAP